MEIKIANMTEASIDDIVEVENKSFTTPWSRKSFIDELNNPLAKYFTAISGEKTVAYLGMWQISGQCDITNIAVLPEYRKKGIAKRLIEHLKQFCIENSLSPITLEVRESNEPAKSLYASMGFEPIGHRKKYYADTGEDAIIMSIIL